MFLLEDRFRGSYYRFYIGNISEDEWKSLKDR